MTSFVPRQRSWGRALTGQSTMRHEDGSQVAMKRLREKIAKSQKEFETEVNVIRKIWHLNLLPTRAYYLGSKEEKFLVFDLMPKGNLSSFLHDKFLFTAALLVVLIEQFFPAPSNQFGGFYGAESSLFPMEFDEDLEIDLVNFFAPASSHLTPTRSPIATTRSHAPLCPTMLHLTSKLAAGKARASLRPHQRIWHGTDSSLWQRTLMEAVQQISKPQFSAIASQDSSPQHKKLLKVYLAKEAM
ncbi:hypothetical protein ZIOFF_007199 [Zingiber officinale]|uniref:Serine-threonine/tyrosine-protein kinase catalytic domain-containing protein n=1 Tax=Zingiber officinale TaxID=94328 RepID=A0A8J5HQM0_ZINOF|nr:hypothetical protein ZIOFF_007199 [Zingiber officinale]